MKDYKTIIETSYGPLADYVDLKPDFFSDFDPKNRKEIVDREVAFYKKLTEPYSVENQLNIKSLSFNSFDLMKIRVRYYEPKVLEGKVSSVLVFIHGGGFVTCSPETHNFVASYISANANIRCFSIDYRLAPENPFPTGLEDCYTVISQILKRSEEFNISREELFICGDSSGGNFVAALTLMARKRKEFVIKKQILIYPVTDLSNTIPSKSERVYSANDVTIPPYREWYLNVGNEGKNVFASPVLADNFRNLPEALFIQAECDALLDDGLIYANFLQKDGVKVEVEIFQGMPHAFILRIYQESFDALNKITQFIKK